MIETLKVSALDKLKDNFTKHPHLPVISHSIALGTEQLQAYLTEAAAKCPGFNGLRLYFIRYDLDKNLPYIDKVPGTDLSQVSIAIVPIKDFDPYTLKGGDYELPHHEIVSLEICPPTAGDWDEGTGLCPPKCN